MRFKIPLKVYKKKAKSNGKSKKMQKNFDATSNRTKSQVFVN